MTRTLLLWTCKDMGCFLVLSQTIFEVLPQLTGVIEEEWLQVVKAFKAFGGVWERGVVIESSNQVLLELTKMITDKTDTGKEVSCIWRLGRR